MSVDPKKATWPMLLIAGAVPKPEKGPAKSTIVVTAPPLPVKMPPTPPRLPTKTTVPESLIEGLPVS